MSDLRDLMIVLLFTTVMCLAAGLFNEVFVKDQKNKNIICDVREEIAKCEINLINAMIQIDEKKTSDSNNGTEKKLEDSPPHFFLRSRIVDKSNVSVHVNKR